MTNRTAFWKLPGAYFLVGIFVCFLAIDIYSSALLDYAYAGKTSVTKISEETILLRNVGAESFSNFPATKKLTFENLEVQGFELHLKNTIQESSLQVCLSLRNVFYVFISSQAP